MKRFNKFVAFILIFNLIMGTMGGLLQGVFAATTSIKIYVDSYDNGTLQIHWDAVAGATSTELTYYTPNASNVGVAQTVVMDPATTKTATITGLENDYIYSFIVQIVTGTGTAVGKMSFLPTVTFNSEMVDQQYVDIDGGGRETGIIPALKLSWMMPRVYNPDTGNFEYVYEAFSAIDTLAKKLNFNIKIEDSEECADIIVNYTGNTTGDPTYEASVSGDTDATRISKVKFDDTTGLLYLYLLGRKDETVSVPTRTEVDANVGGNVVPEYITNLNEGEYTLPDGDILPGSVYTMEMNTLFLNASDVYLDVVSYGLNGNPLAGTLNYTYTPLRFQLTKDSLDNVYVKIYKINEGSLSLPRLYYEVQTNSVPSSQDTTWDLRKSLDDSYFSGDYAYTVISGINVNNELYYRLVVKTDGTEDRLESLKMPYTLGTDTSKPPVPKNILVTKRELVTMEVNSVDLKSTDVTITWDKPTNWTEMKTNNIYFHFLLNTNQTELDISTDPNLYSEGELVGAFPVKYRLVKYVSAQQIDDSGTSLQYTLNGFDLFQGVEADGTVTELPNTEAYPDYLLPNQIYYMQMYTTTELNKGSTDATEMSDKSLITSFTTLAASEREVPLPNNFILNKNVLEGTSPNQQNSIEIQFDKVEIDWANYTANASANDKIYYDIYMSTRTAADSFYRIGTTEFPDSDVGFTGDTDAQSIYIKAKIKYITQGANIYNGRDPYDVFGEALMPNMTYYIVVKTRLVVANAPNTPITKESIATAILPVTTPRKDIADPDETSKKPLAPTDFAIATDANGNQLVSGQTVTFTWTHQEDGITYSLASSTSKVDPDDTVATLSSDATYNSFIDTFDTTDDVNDDTVTIDPLIPRSESGEPIFTYNSTTKKCTYTISTWLFPNRLYYFSLRAETTDSSGVSKESVWVSIPVTTSLIEAPTKLQVISDSELRFYWSDDNENLAAEDFTISLKTSTGSAYTQLARSKYIVVKDIANSSGVSSYYGTIYNLDANTAYCIRVYKPDTTDPVAQILDIYTKDEDHQIEVKWQGLEIDDYSTYEIAIKAEVDDDYTILLDSDLEQFANADGEYFSYHIDKTVLIVGTAYNQYTARINSMAVVLSDGTTVHQALKSNTKYYIKVRAVKTAPTDTTLITYSKYIGPVNIRTEFNQDDYDQDEEETQNEAKFLDKIAKLEESFYWRIEMSNTSKNKLMLKGDRAINSIKNSGGYPFTMDISGIGTDNSIDEVYMPISVLTALNSQNCSLIIKTVGAEFTFMPRTIDVENTAAITKMKTEMADTESEIDLNDIFVKITVARTEQILPAIPSDTERISKINDFETQVIGSSKTEANIKTLMYNSLYNADTGIVKQKTDIMASISDSSALDTAAEVETYINSLLDEAESELSDILKETVEGSSGTTGMIVSEESITTFSNPLVAKLSYNNTKGLKLPYTYYDGSSQWQKISNNVAYYTDAMAFYPISTGKYTVLVVKDATSKLPEGYWATDSINKLLSMYDLSDVFPGISKSINPETTVSVKEMILLYEKVMGSTNENVGLDIRQKVKKLGLDGIINVNGILKDITKQEAATVFIMAYGVKSGLDPGALKAGSTIYITDEKDILAKYFKNVELAIDLSIMTIDFDGNFKPKSSMTRAEVMTAILRAIDN